MQSEFESQTLQLFELIISNTQGRKIGLFDPLGPSNYGHGGTSPQILWGFYPTLRNQSRTNSPINAHLTIAQV